jgi:hypothetical protein
MLSARLAKKNATKLRLSGPIEAPAALREAAGLILADAQNGTSSIDGSLPIQPHGGITLTARMRAYRQASRRVTSFVAVPRDGGAWARRG